jgi:phage baseplate assembly protein W
MPTFIGFNTIDQYKKFTLTDFDLIKRDFLNSLSIRQGERVGKPTVGTNIWDYIFEPMSTSTVASIQQEILRIAGLDPRIQVSNLNITSVELGVVIEMDVQTVATTEAEQLRLFFNQDANTINYV